jgi:2-C-methyl-D-erythritol 4-phosphate cytidylyltransferase/2-C-methyl-D-erythritol 2,4-cyclodiphosphate synthase
VIAAAAETGAAAPAVPERDTVKREQNGLVAETLPRAGLMRVQTPQVFERAAFLEALAALGPKEGEQMTDDCMVMEHAGRPVRLVAGAEANRKITTPEDLPVGGEGPAVLPRVGHGYDVHRLETGRRLILGGVEIPFGKGLQGHSDADVLAHAVADALLGAAALGDIGVHFPPGEAAWKDADSMELLARAAAMVRAAGFAPGNIDATLLCEKPRLAPYIPAMRRGLAAALGVAGGAVSVKATTEEGLGFTGTGQGIAAHCVAVVYGL